MTRMLWGTLWVPLLLFGGISFGETRTPETVRLVTVNACKEIAEAWKTGSGLDLHIEVADLHSSLRILGAQKADYLLIAGSLNPGQKAVITSTPGNLALIHHAGWESLALLVHPSNPISSISLPAARSLFAASGCVEAASPLRDWGDLQGCTGAICSSSIEVLLPHPGSVEEETMKSVLLDGCQPRTDCQILTSDAAIERCVATHPGAIGAVSRLRYIPHARVVPVTPPSNQGGKESKDFLKSDPLARKLNLVARLRFPPNSRQGLFLQYVFSEAGQAELARLGFHPLRKEK